MKDIKEI